MNSSQRIVISLLFFPIALLISAQTVFAGDIVINEFQVDPDASQWVELYNKGSTSIDISGWAIDDDGSASQKFTIPTGTTLTPYEFKVFESSLFNLNRTSSDTIKLFQGSVVEDSYSYTSGPGPNASFGRDNDGAGSWVTFSTPSKGLSNVSSVPAPTVILTPKDVPTATKVPTPTKAPTPTKIPTSTKSPTATTAKIPTSTPAPKKTNEIQVQGSSTSRATPTPDYNVPTAVLAARDENDAWPTIVPLPTKTETKILGTSAINPGIIMIGFGVSVILFSSGLIYYNHRKNQ